MHDKDDERRKSTHMKGGFEMVDMRMDFGTNDHWRNIMPTKADLPFVEKNLSKGHLRKLAALRKSLGDDIANKAFAEWYEKEGAQGDEQEDKNAELVASTLWPLVESKKLVIPKTGYVVKRGRGRLLVEPASKS